MPKPQKTNYQLTMEFEEKKVAKAELQLKSKIEENLFTFNMANYERANFSSN